MAPDSVLLTPFSRAGRPTVAIHVALDLAAQYIERMALYRHGDVLVGSVDELPTGARPRRGLVLARGELTGHVHRIAEESAAELFEDESGTLFLVVRDEVATLVHEEHDAIPLPRGTYRVWRQREYTPERIVRISD